MEKGLNVLNRIAYGVVAVAIMVVGLLLLVLGLTFLPVIGILTGLPVLALSFSLLFPAVRVEERGEADAADAERLETLCPWPRSCSHGKASCHPGAAA